VVSIRRSKITRKEKSAKHLQEEKRRRDNLRERFIKNKRPMNPTHIFPKKEK
jgi:hypothetical protein